jgi:hypothetical protein
VPALHASTSSGEDNPFEQLAPRPAVAIEKAEAEQTGSKLQFVIPDPE